MQYSQIMKSYIVQLTEQAAPTGINLMEFFKMSGVPTSTFYRAKAGKDLRLSTATKVEDAITSYSLHKAESEYD